MFSFYRLRHILFPYKTKDLKFMNIPSVIFVRIIKDEVVSAGLLGTIKWVMF